MTRNTTVMKSTLRQTQKKPAMTYALWTVQILLAILFLFAGGMKLALPVEALTQQMPLPGPFLRFIGVAEVLGAFGLILPGLLRIRQGLTPLAAAGLAIIMIGATVVTAASMGVAPALGPTVVGLLAAFVVYGRSASSWPKRIVGQVESARHNESVRKVRAPLGLAG